MNPLLKAMLKEAMDLVATGQAIVGKQWTKVFSCLVADGADIPPIVANWGDLKPELEKLIADPSVDADLLAYAAGLLPGTVANAQVAAVVLAAADLVLTGGMKVTALVKAIEAAKAPAPAA